jgi:hypothetical protein
MELHLFTHVQKEQTAVYTVAVLEGLVVLIALVLVL